MSTEQKALTQLFIKSNEKGEVEAVIATLGVIDRDGDIITKDAIRSGSRVLMSGYGHDTILTTARPVGKGQVWIERDRAIFRGKLFLDTTDGKETFAVLKEMGADQEWSFGFRVIGTEIPSEQDRQKGARRILTKLDAFEVSPVARGAGVGTQTLAIKDAQAPEDGGQAEFAAMHERVKEIGARLRADEERARREEEPLTAEEREIEESFTRARTTLKRVHEQLDDAYVERPYSDLTSHVVRVVTGWVAPGRKAPAFKFFVKGTRDCDGCFNHLAPDLIRISTDLNEVDLVRVVCHEMSHWSRCDMGLSETTKALVERMAEEDEEALSQRYFAEYGRTERGVWRSCL